MSEARGANSDPSMDDILASIRKIISDDEARAQVIRQQSTPQAERTNVVAQSLPQQETLPRDAAGGDVLLLTNLIEEPAPARAEPEPLAMPRIDPVRAAEMPQPSVEPSAGDDLVGSGVVGVAASAFARLNQAVQDSVPQPAAHEPGPSVDANGKTIEDLVKEMLRPMLKEWLDRNLPPMVERFVEREIVRLTRR